MVKNNFTFFEAANTVGQSNPLSIGDGSALTLEVQVVSGSPTFSIDMVGIVDQNNTNYTKIVYSDSITTSGNAIIGVVGYALVKASITSIVGGTIKVFGRLTS